MFNENEDYCGIQDDSNHRGKFIGAACSACNLRYKTPKENPVIFYNGSDHGYHFIIKELAK